MNENRVHWSFWCIVSLMLVWNVLGCINFLLQLDPEMIASYRDTEQAIIVNRPLWATAGFALGVFAGAAGCIALLLKRRGAFYLFVVSLIGVLVAVTHSLTIDISFGAGEMIGLLLMPILAALFLLWYTQYSQNKGWLINR